MNICVSTTHAPDFQNRMLFIYYHVFIICPFIWSTKLKALYDWEKILCLRAPMINLPCQGLICIKYQGTYWKRTHLQET